MSLAISRLYCNPQCARQSGIVLVPYLTTEGIRFEWLQRDVQLLMVEGLSMLAKFGSGWGCGSSVAGTEVSFGLRL
jgi:hypothetical protein